MDLIAVYTGDSTNFHIFQIVDAEAVGTIYLKKKSSHGIPQGLDVSLITPNSDKELWEIKVKELLKNSREGSKARSKLEKVLGDHK
jgi:hypothetical protein